MKRVALLAAVLVGTTALSMPAQATQYGRYEVHGAIEAKYLAKCGPSGVLGSPITNETPTPDRVGRYNAFANGGSIYWSPGTGANEVHGDIRNVWQAVGWEAGPLGYPITDETSTPGILGRYNAFQRGSVYWSPSTGAHEVYGDIRARWATVGYEGGPLGFPTSGEFSIPGGRMNTFEGGDITWSPAGGATVHVNRGLPSRAPATPVPGGVATPTPPGPGPGGVIVLNGTGSDVVDVSKPAGPMLVQARTTTATSGYFSVTARTGGEYNDLIAIEVGSTDVVRPLDFARFGPARTTNNFVVQADTGVGWQINLVPLAATGAFTRGQTIGEARSTVWRYLGPAGTARIVGGAPNQYFAVTAYNGETSYSGLLVNTANTYFDGRVPIRSDQYLEIDSDGPWSITVS